MSPQPGEEHRRDDDPAQAQHVFPHRQENGPRQRAQARGRNQEAVGVRAAAEDAGREDRQEHGKGHGHQAHQRYREYQVSDGPEPEGMGESFPQLGQEPGPGAYRNAGAGIFIIRRATMAAM